MEDIKIGEYVRTKYGSIGKFKFYGVDDKIVYFKNHNGTNCVDENEVIKHSPNIIDLIEVGDYVNGEIVVEVYQITFNGILEIEVGELSKTLRNKNIETIVTKENFKSVSYEV